MIRAVMALLLLACTSALAPEDPVWNMQPCDHCKMLVSDKRYAASLIDARGQRRFFDDIGCMVMFDGASAKARWVRDEESGAWLDARTAFYRTAAATPMDYGYSAHTSAPGLTYDDLRVALAAKEGERHDAR